MFAMINQIMRQIMQIWRSIMQNYAKLIYYAKNYAIMQFGPNYANYAIGPKLCDKNYANYALHKPRASASGTYPNQYET